MRRISGMLVAGGILLIAAAGSAGVWLLTRPHPISERERALAFDRAADPDNGRLLFAAGDCSSCHASPGQSDRLNLGGGLALASPYGTFHAPNISPDPDYGIGKWTLKDFANALLTGVSPDGSHYYPVFPYPSYTRMTIQDAADLFAYLKTLKPVAQRPPPNELTPPLNIRRFVGFWKLLYFRPGMLMPDPRRDEKWNRGRFLVEGPGHCAECHSSRDVFGGIKDGTRLAGGKNPIGTGFCPNLTPTGLGSWSKKDIVEVLTTGRTPNHGRVGSSMADVVTNTAMLPETDRDAIAAYIKSLPPKPTPQP
ncbi:cytochrome c [Rhodopseudomonas sp. B29]|uniref:c-type cytochrome n=1 Tax=Rhodopseudomonas sp. B29 TaxID=95607 RepID=UPI000687EAD4|nr:cytochrome c [Rhodopseudomonas sp. B29]